jgi:serine/threonine-protein kinase
VYALGAVGYSLLTATTVFRSGTIIDILTAHVKELPQPPSKRLGRQIDPELEKLILRCLAKDPEERPPSAAALLEELLLCDGFRPWTFVDARKWWQQVTSHAAELTQTQQLPTQAMGVGQTVVLK